MIVSPASPGWAPGLEQEDIMIGRLAVAMVVALTLVWPHPAPAELVELSGGQWVEGALKEATPTGVVVEIGGQTVRFSPDRVRAIYFGAPSQSRPAGPQPPQPAPTPQPSAAPSPAADALQVVKSLRSAVPGGMDLREYQVKVREAASVVDRYLAGLQSGRESQIIRDAARYYVLAAAAWSNQGTVSRTVWLPKDDALDRCPLYQDFAREMRSKGEGFYEERVQNYVMISDGVISVLWSCASEKIAEAENLLVDAKN